MIAQGHASPQGAEWSLIEMLYCVSCMQSSTRQHCQHLPDRGRHLRGSRVCMNEEGQQSGGAHQEEDGISAPVQELRHPAQRHGHKQEIQPAGCEQPKNGSYIFDWIYPPCSVAATWKSGGARRAEVQRMQVLQRMLVFKGCTRPTWLWLLSAHGAAVGALHSPGRPTR